MSMKVLNTSIGCRLIYNPTNGFILNTSLYEESGDLYDGLRPTELAFIDLEYGDHSWFDHQNDSYVDINTKKLVVGGICMPDSTPTAER